MAEKPFNDITYNQFLNEEKFMGCRCRKCGNLYVPPRPLCIQCFSSDLEWVQMRGIGRLKAFTCITIAPPFMIAKGYHRKRPYVSGVVELNEGGKVSFIHRKDTEVPESYLAFIPIS